MKETKPSYIKQAERNVINQAKFWTDFQEFIENMRWNIRNSVDNKYDIKDFDAGFELLRKAGYNQQQFALARCFAIQAVGGEEAKEYSKERAKKLFGGEYSTMQWLDENFSLPSYWQTSEEDKFNAELKQALDDMDKAKE